MQVPEWFPEYGGMTLLAAVGSLARGKQWVDPVTGRFVWQKFVTEAATAVGLAVVVISVGTSWHVEPAALGGLCVGAGWLGPATVSDFLLQKLGVKQ